MIHSQLPDGWRLCPVCKSRASRADDPTCPPCLRTLGAGAVQDLRPKRQRAILDVRGKPKGRPRCRTGKPFTPKDTADFEATVATRCALAGFEPLDGPIRVTFRFMGAQADWDNLSKSVCDALNGVAYHDDKQILEAHVYVERKSEQDGIEIVVEQMEQDDEAIATATKVAAARNQALNGILDATTEAQEGTV